MKRGNLLPEESIGLLLAGIFILAIALLLYYLLYPNFNREEKIAESYFNSFKEAVNIADKGGTGVFSTWQKIEETNFYIIYFGEKISFKLGGLTFNSVGENNNHICVCHSSKGKTVCKSCGNLDYPISGEINYWIIEPGKTLEIKKATDENFYRLEEKSR